MGLERYGELVSELNRYLLLDNYPVALRLIRDEAEITDGIKRPLKDLGNRLFICQGYGLTATAGMTLAFTLEDSVCIEGASTLGFIEKPPYLLDGTAIYPRLAPTLDIGRKLEESKPFLDPKKYGYKGIVMSPLARTKIEPQLALFYLDPARLCRCLDAVTGQTGEVIVAKNCGRGGTCVWGVAPAILTGKPTYVIPPFGEFRFAGVRDNEVVFVVPEDWLDILLKGLAHSTKAGQRYPIPRFLNYKPPTPPDMLQFYDYYQKWLKEQAQGDE